MFAPISNQVYALAKHHYKTEFNLNNFDLETLSINDDLIDDVDRDKKLGIYEQALLTLGDYEKNHPVGKDAIVWCKETLTKKEAVTVNGKRYVVYPINRRSDLTRNYQVVGTNITNVFLCANIDIINEGFTGPIDPFPLIAAPYVLLQLFVEIGEDSKIDSVTHEFAVLSKNTRNDIAIKFNGPVKGYKCILSHGSSYSQGFMNELLYRPNTENPVVLENVLKIEAQEEKKEKKERTLYVDLRHPFSQLAQIDDIHVTSSRPKLIKQCEIRLNGDGGKRYTGDQCNMETVQPLVFGEYTHCELRITLMDDAKDGDSITVYRKCNTVKDTRPLFYVLPNLVVKDGQTSYVNPDFQVI